MKTPKERGKAIDNARKQLWLKRFAGYRVEVTEERLQSWLDNFDDEHLDLGARVLDAVTFLTAEDMEKAIRKTVESLPGWDNNPEKLTGKWRFVAFSKSAGESGDTMLHKCRTALRLTRRANDGLFVHKADLLREELEPTDSVVFLDDFAGTGDQACNNGWRELLTELLPGAPKTYLLLVAAGSKAVNRIEAEVGLEVVTRHTLGPEDDIFSPDCEHFTQPEKDFLLSYCKRVAPKAPKGWGDCGFVLVLAHKTPNNTIPVLHVDKKKWKSLFPRQ